MIVDLQTFIKQYAEADVVALALKAHLFPNVDMQQALVQIAGKQKAKSKLPTWVQVEGLEFPVALSLAQCSSEITALFKANWLAEQLQQADQPCTSLADLTGGLGVDSWAFGKFFEQVLYVEQNEKLATIAKKNFELLEKARSNLSDTSQVSDKWDLLNAQALDNQKQNIQVLNLQLNKENLQTLAKYISTPLSCLYLDPARRNEKQQKVASLQDCEPNIVDWLPHLWHYAPVILLKTSPMLDVQQAVAELKTVQKIVVLAHENECKEVLYLLSNQAINYQEIPILAVNLTKNGNQIFTFTRQEEQAKQANLVLPQQYLYEPNVALLKAGAFQTIAQRWQVGKLHTHTHLYTSETPITDFMGRSFKILHQTQLDKKILATLLPEGKANITIRNFPLSVEEIRKKTGIKEGGSTYIFATTNYKNQKILLLCKQV